MAWTPVARAAAALRAVPRCRRSPWRTGGRTGPSLCTPPARGRGPRKAACGACSSARKHRAHVAHEAFHARPFLRPPLLCARRAPSHRRHSHGDATDSNTAVFSNTLFVLIAPHVVELARRLPESPEVGRTHPKLAEIARNRAKVARTWSISRGLVLLWPSLGQIMADGQTLPPVKIYAAEARQEQIPVKIPVGAAPKSETAESALREVCHEPPQGCSGPLQSP